MAVAVVAVVTALQIYLKLPNGQSRARLFCLSLLRTARFKLQNGLSGLAVRHVLASFLGRMVMILPRLLTPRSRLPTGGENAVARQRYFYYLCIR